MPKIPPGFVLEEPNIQIPEGFVLDSGAQNDTSQRANFISAREQTLQNAANRRAFKIGDQGQATEIPTTPEPKPPLFQNIVESITPRGGLIPPERIKPTAEVAATLATGGAAMPAAGVAGLAGLVPAFAGDGEESLKRGMESVQKGLTYQPRTEAAQQAMGTIGDVAGKIPDISKIMGDFIMEKTGSPVAGTAASLLPEIASIAVGLKFFQKLRPGTILKDSAGNPTKILRKELDKQGLDYDSLSVEEKNIIPSTVDPNMLGVKKVNPVIENTVKERVKFGGNESSLAGLKVVKDEIVPDALANKAMRQGWEAGDIQPIKNSSPETKKRMIKMLGMMRRIKKDKSLALEINPIDVIGDSIGDRIGFVRNEINKARGELNTIANSRFKGKYADKDLVLQSVKDSFSEFEIGLKKKDGKLVPDFEGSDIKDGGSKRVVREILKDVQQNINGDAYRFHKLKKRMDSLINYDRKQLLLKAGPEGEKIAKNVRFAVNDTLRALDSSYANVNDRLSSALTAIGDLDKSVGNIELLGKGSNQALGRKAMTLLSRNHGVTKINNAIDQLNDVSSKFGGKFNDDTKKLVMFQDALNKRLGAQEGTSLAGQVSEAIQGSARKIGMGKKELLIEGISTVGKGIERMTGINEFNSFETMSNLLRNN